MVPKLRFSEFKGKWQSDLFGNVVTNKSAKYNPLTEGEDLPCLEMDSISQEDGRILYIYSAKQQASIKNKFSSGDVLFGKLRPYLRKYILAPFDGVCSSEVWVFHGLNVNNKFLFHYIQTNKFIECANKSSGSKMPRADWSVVSSEMMFFPQEEEQVKIANFLSYVDEKITLLNKQYDLLCQYKKSIMQKIFSQKLQFNDENGETFPEWIQTSLGTISKVYDGTHQTPDYVEFGVPFYSVEHVTADSFDDTKYISEDVFEQESKRVSIQQGDILMTRIGDIGTVKYINWIPRASFYVSLSLIKVRESFDSKMISYCMQSDFFQKELHEKTIHVAFPKKINLGEISNCKIKMPASKKEQTKIVILLSAIDDKIASKKAELDRLKTWKQGLLQQMFV